MELVAGQADWCLIALQTPSQLFAPSAPLQTSFTPLSLILFLLRLMVAQVPPTVVRLVPRALPGCSQGSVNLQSSCWEDPASAAEAQGLIRGKALCTSLRRGHYLPHAPLGMQGSGTAGNLSLQVVPASGHGGASAQHHGGSAHSAILLCRNVTGITSAQPFLLTPAVSGSHRLLCTVPDSCCTAGPGGTILKFPFILM